MGNDLLNGNLSNLVNLITVTGMLGIGAFGLVDASKSIRGGASNVGFSFIKKELALFEEPLKTIGKGAPLRTLKANWLNGVTKADQKATAKSLIRLSLKPDNAEDLASATGLNAVTLKVLATSIVEGSTLDQEEINFLGRFDAIVSTILDAAYERGDQQYRNTAKALAAIVATVLAVVAGGVVFFSNQAGATIPAYITSSEFLTATLVGLVSTPLAPVAKDISSTLQAAVKAVNAVHR
jgi:hypothetical protein